MLADAESDIRKQLPNFNAKQVLTTNIDNFHKSPSHQRSVLTQLRSTHVTQLAIGVRTFKLILNPIIDNKGQRIGTVVEWKDQTEEIAIRNKELTLANENSRVKSALDNCTTNVMIADNDGHIVYLNHSIVDMLTKAEADIRKQLPQFNVRSYRC